MDKKKFENLKYVGSISKVVVNIPNEEELKGALQSQDKIEIKDINEEIKLNVERKMFFDEIKNFDIDCIFTVNINNKWNFKKKDIEKAIKEELLNYIITDIYSDISLIIATLTKCSYFGTIVTIPATIYEDLIVK